MIKKLRHILCFFNVEVNSNILGKIEILMLVSKNIIILTQCGSTKTRITSEWNILSLYQLDIIVEKHFFA